MMANYTTKDAAHNRGYEAAMAGKPRSVFPKNKSMELFNEFNKGYNMGLRAKSFPKRLNRYKTI